MQLKCSKCQTIFIVPDDKIPRDKEKAMVKCPKCAQILVFAIPAHMRQQAVAAEKTVINIAGNKPVNPRLVRVDDGMEFMLKDGRNVLGRNADLSIAGDKYISRIHCVIEVINQFGMKQCILTDDGSGDPNRQPSTNGTFLNNLRLTPLDKFFLNPGDKVRIGHTEFTFLTD